MPPALDEAVKSAVETEVQPSVPVETKTVETETQQETDKAIEPEPKLDAKTQAALRLYEALEDPAIGPSILKQLAEKAGLLVKEEDRTVKQAKKAATEVLKESLGEYAFLADSLGPVLDQLINEAVDSRVRPALEMLNKQTERTITKETDVVFEGFYKRHPDAKEFDTQLTELGKKLPWSGDYPMDEYLEMLYTVATKDKAETTTVKKTVDKINQNAKGVRATSTGAAEPKEVKMGSKLPSLNEAIFAAARGERLV